MPSWWGKSSSKEVKKKANKENFIDALQRKLRLPSDNKGSGRHGSSKRHASDIVQERGFLSRAESRSQSPSSHVSRCQSFADMDRPPAQPLPLPGIHASNIERVPSELGISRPESVKRVPPTCIPIQADPTDIDGDLVTASASSSSPIDSDDQIDRHHLNLRANGFTNGMKAIPNNPSSKTQKEPSPASTKRNKDTLKPAKLSFINQNLSTSPKQGHLNAYQHTLWGPYNNALGSAPDSSMSSPSRSPIRAFGPEKFAGSAFWGAKPYTDVALVGSGQCSSPGSGHNSGHNSMGGDFTVQAFWAHSRGSAECSPIPSPRMTSPGPSSRVHSGAVTPLHPRAGGTTPDSPSHWTDDGKQQCHRLPLPPITITNSSPFSATNLTSPVSRSPGRTENPTSPGSRWKKGKLLGSGTFGHVFVGFNSESGEMCAMKEVTLFSDDAKSRECAKQLGQEVTVLSRLHHPNIVQYYGSETVDDKLYIYLEYVSGGSIHKLLQDYGQLGEPAIRSYTQQILSGLAYLHAKNNVHRDIKGANILVDPNGRVKLADFGMAKHITGQSCPLSFKGSPYWMAPEVFKNSNGCNLAVDIWSLGCTVIEMATAKPPWSQYEGVAAMFKIGNSKELPAIPEHLSDEGKDFIRQCLQRNPLHRPTAAQLLEHPFVKNASTVERPVIRSKLTELPTSPSNGIRSMGFSHAKHLSSLDMEGLSIGQPIVNKISSSDYYAQKNISCPVSPIGSPLLHSRSPQHINGRMSPSPISSPRATSGSSTPLTGGNGAIPFHHVNHATYLHEGFTSMPRSPNNHYMNGSAYLHQKPDFFRGIHTHPHVSRELTSSENDILGRSFGQPHTDPRELYNRQLILAANRVSQQLLRDHAKLNQSLDITFGSQFLGHKVGI